MNKKIAPSSRIEALEKIRDKHSGNDAGTQSKRLLEAMQSLGSISMSRAKDRALKTAKEATRRRAHGNNVRSPQMN